MMTTNDVDSFTIDKLMAAKKIFEDESRWTPGVITIHSQESIEYIGEGEDFKMGTDDTNFVSYLNGDLGTYGHVVLHDHLQAQEAFPSWYENGIKMVSPTTSKTTPKMREEIIYADD